MNATTIQTTDVRRIPLEALHFSEAPAQVERRKRYDPNALNELAETLKSEGQLQPIVVRPIVWGEEHRFEIIAGERRARGQKLAGFADILALVRELDDHQAAKVRLIENLQREEEHPLAEAEGYGELVRVHGYTVDQIAEETGKSKAYVYARLKLLELGSEGRQLMYDGKISASIALLAARIPVLDLQQKFLQKVLKGAYGDGEPLSYRDAQHLAQTEYMLRLDQAPFRTSDEMLVPRAGACGTCPKNTSCQPELFADVSTKSLCTDPECFAEKRAAAIAQKIEAAKASGQTVITGKEAKKIAPYGEHNLAGGYVRLDAGCFEDPKIRSYKQLLGKKASPVLVETPNGTLIEAINQAEALEQLRADGIIKSEKRVTTVKRSGGSPKTAAQKAMHAAEIEDEFEKRLYLAIHAKAPKQLPRGTLNFIANAEIEMLNIGRDEQLCEAWGWKNLPSEKEIAKLSDAQLHQLLFEIVMLHTNGPSNALELSAKFLKIDAKKIRAEVAASLKAPAPPAPAKSTKKKAARK